MSASASCTQMRRVGEAAASAAFRSATEPKGTYPIAPPACSQSMSFNAVRA